MNSILIVDTDGKALSDLQRRLRKKFTTHIALGPRLGLQRIQEEGPFALVLAEFSMPEMDGVDFMAKAGELCPESTRVLYSRAALDAGDLMRAINEARVFHVLPASCDEQTLIEVVQEGIDRFKRTSTSVANMNEVHAIFAKAVHELVCWLRGDVRDMISPVLPLLRGLCRNTRHKDPTLTETAFLLSVIGLIALPPSLLQKIAAGETLTEDERLIFAQHPEHAVEWVRHLPQLDEVVAILQGYADFLRLALQPGADTSGIPQSSALLAMSMEFRLAGYGKLEDGAILARMRGAGVYTQALLKAMETELTRMDQSEIEIEQSKLQPGMVLARSVIGTREGGDVVLVPEGYELSRTTIVFLRQAARHGQVRDPFFIRKMSLTPPEGNDTA
jgi:CheY-like chemotaxis protein